MMPDEYERLILEELTGRGFVLAPRAAYELPANERNLYLWLLLRADKYGRLSYVRRDAEEALSLTTKQVRSAEERLDTRGWISRAAGRQLDGSGQVDVTVLHFKEIQSMRAYGGQQVGSGSADINKVCTTVHVQPELSQQEPKHLRCPFCVEGITPAGWPCGYCLPEKHAEWLKLDEAGRREYEERLCDETRARMRAEAAGGGVSA